VNKYLVEAVRSSRLTQTYSRAGDAHREERNRLRAMIFGQPLVEPQVATLRVVAIDCEMVGVGPVTGYKCRGGKQVSALARVSIVDFHGNIVLDAYVKPNEAVTDYRTSVSGIRPSDLSGEKAISFAVAKAQVSHILKGRIVVGHAIHYDLRVRSYPVTVSVSKLD
jgi:RNA exonuclease 4